MPGVDSGVSRAESKVVGGRAMEEGAGPREDDMLGRTKGSLLAEARSDGDLLWCCTVSAVLPRVGRWGGWWEGERARAVDVVGSSAARANGSCNSSREHTTELFAITQSSTSG